MRKTNCNLWVNCSFWCQGFISFLSNQSRWELDRQAFSILTFKSLAMRSDKLANTTRENLSSVLLLSIPVVAALCLVFLFYIPSINQAIRDNLLPREALSLKIHIAVYCLSYCLFCAGLFLTIFRLITRSLTPRYWIEATVIIATLLAILGLVFGVLASNSMWGSFWVWDIKLIATINTTVAFVVISVAVILTRFISDEKFSNISLLFLLLIAVFLCVVLFLIGRAFGRTIHPQWFPEFLFR